MTNDEVKEEDEEDDNDDGDEYSGISQHSLC